MYFLKIFSLVQIALLAKIIVQKVSYFFLKQIGTQFKQNHLIVLFSRCCIIYRLPEMFMVDMIEENKCYDSHTYMLRNDNHCLEQ